MTRAQPGNTARHIFLAGDIGGTKTTLALISTDLGPRRPLTIETIPSGEHPSLESIVTRFLAHKVVPLNRAVFGVAGPVVDGRARVTNLPWTVDANNLQQILDAPVRLLNDLEAIAHVIPFLEDAEVESLNRGEPVEHGPLAVIAPGTGLGEAFLLWDGTRYQPHASEGGHTDFAPTNQTEAELLAFLLPRLGHVSYEQVCSGRGVPHLYAFLRDTGRVAEPAWLREKLALAGDLTPIIIQAAIEERADICTAVLDLFVSILGSEAGNLALKVLATGGVYLAGGIPPRILPQLKTQALMRAFTSKGRLSEQLARVPICVVCDPHAALFGAAYHGLEQMAGL